MNCIECRYKLSAYQVCKDCNKESQQEIQVLKSSFEKLLLELNQLKDKEWGHLDTIHRRNMQIKELKKQLADSINKNQLKWKCFTCGQVYTFSTLEPLKNTIPSCFCEKPDCRIVINR